MEGWIKISRNIRNHWIWQKPEYFQWWADLLMSAEWTDTKKLVGGKVVEVKRGQEIVSLRYLQKAWERKDNRGNVISTPSFNTVLRFLNLLEQEEMILREKREHQITILTICNYERYQEKDYTGDSTYASTSDSTYASTYGSTNASTYDSKIKNNKNIEEYKEEEEINKETVSDDTVKKVPDRNLKFDKAAELWNEICGDVLPKVLKLTDTRRKKILARAAESKCKTMDEWTAWLTDYFKKLRASDFACKGTWCSFDWAFDNGNNWVKTMEGNYDNKETAQDTRHMTIQERVMAEHPNMKLNEAAYEHIAKDGRRTYGSSETKTVPYDAPPRPNNFYVWCEPTQEWVANY